MFCERPRPQGGVFFFGALTDRAACEILVPMRRSLLLLTVLLLGALPSAGQSDKSRPAHSRYTTPDLKVGDMAPDFELIQLDESGSNQTQRVKLSSWQGRKPVLLFFSSYT